MFWLLHSHESFNILLRNESTDSLPKYLRLTWSLSLSVFLSCCYTEVCCLWARFLGAGVLLCPSNLFSSLKTTWPEWGPPNKLSPCVLGEKGEKTDAQIKPEIENHLSQLRRVQRFAFQVWRCEKKVRSQKDSLDVYVDHGSRRH